VSARTKANRPTLRGENGITYPTDLVPNFVKITLREIINFRKSDPVFDISGACEGKARVRQLAVFCAISITDGQESIID
jgi:hypothetical protein